MAENTFDRLVRQLFKTKNIEEIPQDKLIEGLLNSTEYNKLKFPRSASRVGFSKIGKLITKDGVLSEQGIFTRIPRFKLHDELEWLRFNEYVDAIDKSITHSKDPRLIRMLEQKKRALLEYSFKYPDTIKRTKLPKNFRDYLLRQADDVLDNIDFKRLRVKEKAVADMNFRTVNEVNKLIRQGVDARNIASDPIFLDDIKETGGFIRSKGVKEELRKRIAGKLARFGDRVVASFDDAKFMEQVSPAVEDESNIAGKIIDEIVDRPEPIQKTVKKTLGEVRRRADEVADIGEDMFRGMSEADVEKMARREGIERVVAESFEDVAKKTSKSVSMADEMIDIARETVRMTGQLPKEMVDELKSRGLKSSQIDDIIKVAVKGTKGQSGRISTRMLGQLGLGLGKLGSAMGIVEGLATDVNASEFPPEFAQAVADKEDIDYIQGIREVRDIFKDQMFRSGFESEEGDPIGINLEALLSEFQGR